MREKLSVLIPCFNNEDIIEDCLRSVRWADEVVVCDSFSTDGTLDIAGRYADRIIQREYQNSASQKNWAIPQLAHCWALIVDTDERVSESLRAEIQAVLENPGGATAFRIPRANHVFGRVLRHGGSWPDYQIRLFQRDHARYEDREVHAHMVVDGEVGTLSSPLHHFPHRSLRSFRRVLLQRYTTWEALQKHKQGVKFHWHTVLIRPPGAFIHRYVVRQGYRDGWQGLFMASLWGTYVAITYLKLRKLQRSAAP